MNEAHTGGHQDEHIPHLGRQFGDGFDHAVQQGHTTSSGRRTGGTRRGDFLQRWGWALVAVGALAAAAHLTRYDHWHDSTGREYVWDRWTRESCVFITWRPSLPTVCRHLSSSATVRVGGSTMQDATAVPQGSTR